MTNNTTIATLALAVEVANREIGTLNAQIADMEAAADLGAGGAEEVVFLEAQAAPTVIMPTRGTANAPGAVGRPDARHKGAKTDASTFVPASALGTLRMKVLIACFYSAAPLGIGAPVTPKWLAANVADENGFANWDHAHSAAAGRSRLANAGLLDRHGPASKATGFTANLALFQGACSRLVWQAGRIAHHELTIESCQVQPV